ncbi:hypothetical protein B0H19DRAFT_1274259 [Mycena capillaripes]|nr:hypothetical protein B0H19DRAFT_1274259 [Mycena capillaripes]
MSQNRSAADAIHINHAILGRKQAQIFAPFLSTTTTTTPPPPSVITLLYTEKRVAMASKHTPDDQKLIDSLSMGVVTAFRSSIYQPGFIVGNPHLFINNDWIDAVQLRAFPKNTTAHPDNSVPAGVKVENDASDASDASIMRAFTVPDVRVRILTEGTQEVLEILSDSEDTVGSPGLSPANLRILRLTDSHLPPPPPSPLVTLQSSPFPSSHIPSDSTLDTAAYDRQSSPSDMLSDFASHGDSESDTVADLDGYFSSDVLEVVPGLQKSDTAWLDEELSSRVRIGEFQVTAEVTVERVEYLTELPLFTRSPRRRQ